jgi:hypothetical protein
VKGGQPGMSGLFLFHYGVVICEVIGGAGSGDA